jgi:hypothetical protein
MEAITRYDCTMVDPKDDRQPWASMLPAKHGRWTSYEEHLAAVAALREALKEAHSLLRRAVHITAVQKQCGQFWVDDVSKLLAYPPAALKSEAL